MPCSGAEVTECLPHERIVPACLKEIIVPLSTLLEPGGGALRTVDGLA